MDSPFETLSLALAMTYESDDRGNVTTKAAHNVVIIFLSMKTWALEKACEDQTLLSL
jgi:hypothetical protein